ncbi:MAG TPA: glycosyltransferase family 9 protein [Saprospiraceae bacterium]|nr:glycosyltransferase family 9 protein [Saprospiraceae bacterium]
MSARKKVLIIRFSSIGDIVLTTPIVRCLKQQLGAEIHYLVKESYASALHPNPYIDRLITIKKDVDEVLPTLREIKYDWIADLHHNLRSFNVKQALRRPGASFPKLNIEKWLMTNFKINRLPDVHIVDRYFETVKTLGVINDGRGLDFFIAADTRIDVQQISNNKLPPGSYVAMAIGAGHATKNLEDAQWLSLIKSLSMPVALLGGPTDAARGSWLASQSNNCFNFAGLISLPQSASVIEQSALLITPDTGLMHIAVALHKPVISVWGNTIPEFGMTPYYPHDLQIKNQEFEIKNLPCRPCSKIGYAKCPKGHFRCIRDIALKEIAIVATQIFESSRP